MTAGNQGASGWLQHALFVFQMLLILSFNILFSFVCSASGTSAVAIDNKIEQAMVSVYLVYDTFI